MQPGAAVHLDKHALLCGPFLYTSVKVWPSLGPLSWPLSNYGPPRAPVKFYGPPEPLLSPPGVSKRNSTTPSQNSSRERPMAATHYSASSILHAAWRAVIAQVLLGVQTRGAARARTEAKLKKRRRYAGGERGTRRRWRRTRR